MTIASYSSRGSFGAIAGIARGRPTGVLVAGRTRWKEGGSRHFRPGGRLCLNSSEVKHSPGPAQVGVDVDEAGLLGNREAAGEG
jgi:hypothetical protein